MRHSYESMPKPSVTAGFFLFPSVSESGGCVSRRMRHEQFVVEKFLHSGITKKNLAEPHDTPSTNQRDLGVCEMSGEPSSIGWSADVMWKIPHYSVICCCLLNCEELHELYLSCFLYHCQSLFGLESAIFLLTLALFHFACLQWLYISNICNLLIFFRIHPCKMVNKVQILLFCKTIIIVHVIKSLNWFHIKISIIGLHILYR